ncbi:MAG: GlsB/YeaQ/YmgE family stress response membrane protein [Candidatus Limnocylindrales bacterium]
MFLLLAFIVIALVAGFIANFLVAGKRKYETWELFVIGIVGSFVGGLIFSLIAGDGLELRPTGLIGSILGAIVALIIYGPIRDQLRKRNV